MPKFKRQCNNPFHEKWSGREGEKVVNLRNRGLLVISVVFEQYVQAELGEKSSYGIQNLCTTCLQKCFTKRKFTQFLPNQQANEVKNNEEKQLRVLAAENIITSSKLQEETRRVSPQGGETSTASVNSPIINSQLSNEETISCCSNQTIEICSQELEGGPSITTAEQECQTDNGVFLSKDKYEELVLKASSYPNFKNDLNKLRPVVSKLAQPEMDPDAFEIICKEAGAEKLYSCIQEAIMLDQISEKRKNLNKMRTMVIIYIMLYSQSQKCNAFQVTLSRTLQQFGISKQGLESLRNLGIVAHPKTVNILTKLSSSTHTSHVVAFIENAIKSRQFLIFCIDDYHNIHTQHRPETKTQTQVVHMSTLLLKVFPEIQAVPQMGFNDMLPKCPVEIPDVKNFISNNISSLSKTYVENMPSWALSKYFDPEAERQRLLIHDYQQTENQQIRCMDNTKLVDSIELPLKSVENALTAINKMLSSGLEIYLKDFIAAFVGDWPMQYFIRQLVYSSAPSVPAALKNVVPLIGPLHISLNARECVLLNFHDVFADLYAFIFGTNAKLAKKPKPWRISLLLEVIYGGWTLIRDIILSVFYKSKDVQFLTLLNLLDNYIPMVLSIYSIAFKCNKFELYFQSLLHCWVMFVIFRRRHYNKALLIALSTFLHWQGNATAMFETIRQHLPAFDEYPVENFHSVLRKHTRETDTADEISRKAKEIDASKHELHSFQSAFVPPRKLNYSRKQINTLKVKAAEFLTLKFESIFTHPNMAVQQPHAPRQPKHTSKWNLPHLFGEKIVSNQVLPLGFTSVKNPPNPNRKCDLISCNKVNPLWNVFRGCGHSFHIECILPSINDCPVCEATLLSSVQDLGTTANNAVFTPAVNFEADQQSDDDINNEEDIDDDDNDAERTEVEENEITVDQLLQKISLWRSAEIPESATVLRRPILSRRKKSKRAVQKDSRKMAGDLVGVKSLQHSDVPINNPSQISM